jgi:hypothetical protein
MVKGVVLGLLSFHRQVESRVRTQCCLQKVESLALSACYSTLTPLVIPPAGGIRGPHTMLPAKVESFAPSACHSTTPFCLSFHHPLTRLSFHRQVESEDRTQCCLQKLKALPLLLAIPPLPSTCHSTSRWNPRTAHNAACIKLKALPLLLVSRPSPYCLSFHRQVESMDCTQCCLQKVENIAIAACCFTLTLLAIPPLPSACHSTGRWNPRTAHNAAGRKV